MHTQNLVLNLGGHAIYDVLYEVDRTRRAGGDMLRLVRVELRWMESRRFIALAKSIQSPDLRR